MRWVWLPFVFFALPCFSQRVELVPPPKQITYTSPRFELGQSPVLGRVKQELLSTRDTVLGDEGYRASVVSGSASVSANTTAGLYYGILTLKTLLAFDSVTQRYYLPGVEITDYPRYVYRGMHLDVSRHFFSVKTVKQYLDTLAQCRVNYFHWHLTDDQGWRIEIKKYPKLTETGAWRTEADGSRYGGYYTQQEISEVVDYAAQRHITVIPEIEMPGHSSAAIAAYPWLSGAGNAVTVPNHWGIFEEVYCPNDSVFMFLKDVLDEVCRLFPGPYIHIGGDEVPKAQRKQSAQVSDLMKEKNLKNYEEVQHYLMHTIEDYLAQKGKRCIGWGEVVRGGLSDSMIVMSWRGKAAGIKAAKLGHDVVMAPRFFCYFDYPQTGDKKAAWWMTRLTVQKVSKYTPKSALLHASQNEHILGGEATLWTEYVPDEKKLWHQLMPRLKVWSATLW